MDKTFNWTAAIPWGISLAALTWGIVQYTLSTNQANRVPFLQKQLEVVLDATDAAGQMATYADPDKWNAAREHFRTLYTGKMVMVENSELAQAMIAFGTQADLGGPPESGLPRFDLINAALKLDIAARNFVLSSWGIGLANLNNSDDPKAPVEKDPKWQPS
jgi:hypothetical protein